MDLINILIGFGTITIIYGFLVTVSILLSIYLDGIPLKEQDLTLVLAKGPAAVLIFIAMFFAVMILICSVLMVVGSLVRGLL